jgi:Flp pilus assembly protein TadG
MGLGRSSIMRGRDRRRGSEFVEGMLIMLPFLALVFLIIDTSYGIFLDATLNYAVQAGVNYATTDTADGLEAGIQSTVQAQSMNLVPAANVIVSFLTPTPSGMTTPTPGSVLNQAGNVVQVAVTYPFAPLAPLFRSGATITLSATAASALTANPPPSL